MQNSCRQIGETVTFLAYSQYRKIGRLETKPPANFRSGLQEFINDLPLV